jgi:serine O-acetyltransferase
LLRACSDVANFACHVLFKVDLLPTTEVEPGVYIADGGHVIAGAQHIGAGTVIHRRVTIGRQPMREGAPVIGRNVWIGPDCIIYGNVDLGDGATLLPCSVVTRTLPSGAVAAGNPAQVVARNFDNSALRSTLSTDAASLLPDLRSR